MSSPQVPHITDMAMVVGTAQDGLSGDEEWEDEQERWGDDAMLEWNAPTNLSQGMQDKTFESAMQADFQPPQSPQPTEIDWSMGPPGGESSRVETTVTLPRSKRAATSIRPPREDVPVSPRVETPEDRIQALLDRGMPDYASWDLPDLQVRLYRAFSEPH